MAVYTIKKGDTLSKIAQQYGTTVDAIAKENNISDPNTIYAGATLNIGQNTANTSNTTSTTASNNQTNVNLTSSGLGTYGFTQSQAVTDAYNKYQSMINNKPADYQSSYKNQINSLLNEIQSSKFSYDMNADALYQQYANKYKEAGNQAMRDTIADAASLSGGYGNSYATTAAAQAYNSYLSGMSDVVPELYQSAYNIYANELNNKQNQLSNLQTLEDTDYNKYLNELNAYNTELSNAYNNYTTLYGNEYNEYLNRQNEILAAQEAAAAAQSESSSYKAGSSTSYKIAAAKALANKNKGISASDIMTSLYEDYNAGKITAEELEMIWYSDLGLTDADLTGTTTNKTSGSSTNSISNFSTGTKSNSALATSLGYLKSNSLNPSLIGQSQTAISKRKHGGSGRTF